MSELSEFKLIEKLQVFYKIYSRFLIWKGYTKVFANIGCPNAVKGIGQLDATENKSKHFYQHPSIQFEINTFFQVKLKLKEQQYSCKADDFRLRANTR